MQIHIINKMNKSYLTDHTLIVHELERSIKIYNWDFISNSFSLDLNTKTINAKGVPDIQVADAYIIPENEELYIREGFQILPLSNSVLVLDTINEFHRFVNSNVSVLTKDKFEGKGVYEYVNFDLDTSIFLFLSLS